MRDEYLQAAAKIINDPYILVNVGSRRAKQLRRGSRPLVGSLEKLSAETTALREIAEGRISNELDMAVTKKGQALAYTRDALTPRGTRPPKIRSCRGPRRRFRRSPPASRRGHAA